MILPPVSQEYKPETHNVMLHEIEKSDGQNLKLDQDNFLTTGSICLQNGDGDWFKLGVNTATPPVLIITKLAGTQLDASGRPVLASTNPYVT